MNTIKKPRLKDLYALRERIKFEMLGQDDQEYRTELELLLERTDAKIRELSVE